MGGFEGAKIWKQVTRYGVGFLGSGPVAQAIHVPFVRNFPEVLDLISFMDVAPDLVRELGLQHNAKWTIDEDELINDPLIDVVVIGSPNSHHARQIIKCCNAGKRLILAEKPLAISVDELNDIKVAAFESGTVIVVGTMHAYDDAFLEALEYWKTLNISPSSVEVNCYLPTNDEMVDNATELIRSSVLASSDSSIPPSSVKTLLTGGILGLAMHDIPAVREFIPSVIQMTRAQYVSPWGYLLEGFSDDIAVRFVGQMPGAWSAHWTMTVTGDQGTMHIDFQPSYVDSGSAVVSVKTGNLTYVFRREVSPYASEWREIINILNGDKAPIYDLERISDDLEFALSIIDQLQDDGI